ASKQLARFIIGVETSDEARSIGCGLSSRDSACDRSKGAAVGILDDGCVCFVNRSDQVPRKIEEAEELLLVVAVAHKGPDHAEPAERKDAIKRGRARVSHSLDWARCDSNADPAAAHRGTAAVDAVRVATSVRDVEAPVSPDGNAVTR